MNSIQNQRLSLFDYLDPKSNQSTSLDEVVKRSQQTPSAGIDEVHQSLSSLPSMDALVDGIVNGESTVSHQTVEDMWAFYGQQVKDEVEQLAQNYNVAEMPALANIDGQWQAVAGQSLSKSQQQFLDYLNRDQRLSDRLSRLDSLTQLKELSHSHSLASALQAQGNDEATVTGYLVSTRDAIINNRALGLVDGKLSFAQAGIAQRQFELLVS